MALDPAADPDRYDPSRAGRPDPRAGDRSDDDAVGLPEDRPSPYVFLLGLLAVAAFLGLVAFVFSHLSP